MYDCPENVTLMDTDWDDVLWNEQQYGALETQGCLNPNQPQLHKVLDTPSDDKIKIRLCMMRLPLMKTLLYYCMTSMSNKCARMETVFIYLLQYMYLNCAYM